jgi:uncharacterized membrane protein YjgN (DUF898 family)/ribosomal protein L32
MMYGVKCPKCGLMQLPKEICESCGKKMNLTAPITPVKRGSAKEIETPKDPPKPTSKKATEILRSERRVGGSHLLSFHGSGGNLFGIYLVNILLTLITLGFYSFWGKVKVRNYILSQTEFNGDRFGYHGTGKELFFGFLKAVAVFILPIVLLNIAPKLAGAGVHGKMTAGFFVYGLITLFVPLAMVGTWRYRLSRTSWRGIRFSFRGKTGDFLKLFLSGSFLTVITLGLYYPFFATQRHGFMVSNSYFGTEKFEFDGNGCELFKPFLLALLLTLPTLGMYWYWFLAKKQRFFWEHTSLGPLRFQSTVTGGSLLSFHSGNLLLLILTLGLAWPWVVVRKINFQFQYLRLEGALELGHIKQEAQVASATGEGLSSFMDVGFDLT